MSDDAGERFVSSPTAGRCFSARSAISFTDCDTTGRARFDSLVRHIQELAGRDNDDAGVGGTWVVRSTALQIGQSLVLNEPYVGATWCSGIGRRWTERRTSLAGDWGGEVEAAVLWVHVDPHNGAPAPLPPSFESIYGEAAEGRRVSARLRHSLPPPDGEGFRWQIRRSDLDVLGHVNNAAVWEILEEFWPEGRSRRVVAEVEHREALNHGEPVIGRFVREDESLTVGVFQNDKAAVTIVAGSPEPV